MEQENLEQKIEEPTMVQKVVKKVVDFYRDYISISGLPHEGNECYRERDRYIEK